MTCSYCNSANVALTANGNIRRCGDCGNAELLRAGLLPFRKIRSLERDLRQTKVWMQQR